MFVRTQRLTLRPAWREDATELSRAIGHESVVRNLSQAPWPYSLGDARAFIDARGEAGDSVHFFLICEHRDGMAPIVGGIGIHPTDDGRHELGYWLTPSAWGRGIATEAGHGVLAAARDTLRLGRLVAGHFVDNPASGKVLRKLGFRPTGRIVPRTSRGRGGETPCAQFEVDLCSSDVGDPEPRMAA